MFSLTFRRYVGEKKRLGISLGPCVALPLYASEQLRYARTSSYMPQKSEHVAPRTFSTDVEWEDSCVGVKVGVDYEFEHGFLLGVDLNMLSPPMRSSRSFESISSSPLFSLSLKLGWNLHAIFGDESMA